MTVTFPTCIPQFRAVPALLGAGAEHVQPCERSLPQRNRLPPLRVVLSRRPPKALDSNNGETKMKTVTVVAMALALGALGACKKSPNEAAADNVEANYSNAAENVEDSTSNAAKAI